MIDTNCGSMLTLGLRINMDALLEQRLDKIESLLKALINQQVVKSHYSTAEVAQAVQKSEYTVREWCRLGRLQAKKKYSGRGSSLEWVVTHSELERYRQNGLLPHGTILNERNAMYGK